MRAALQDLRDAQHAVDLLIELEELVSRHGAFGYSEWADLHYRVKKKPQPVSMQRKFERWKQALSKHGGQLEWDAQECCYVAPSNLPALIEKAQERRDVFGAALRGTRRRRVPKEGRLPCAKERLPVAEARPRLEAVRDYLELSYGRMAELLGVKVVTLKVWMGKGGPFKRTKTVPLWAVKSAEALLEVEEVSPFCMTRLQRISKEDVLSAWEKSGERIKRAARLLKVADKTFHVLCGHYRIDLPEKVEPVVERVGRKQIRRAMAKHDFVLNRARKDLGLSLTGLKTAIKAYGMQDEFKDKIRSPGQRPRKITCIDLVRARNEGLSLAATAKQLKVSKSGVRKAYKDLGVKRSAASNPRQHCMNKEELRGILAEAEKHGMNKSDLTQALEISHSALKRMFSEHKLLRRWEGLQATNHRGKGEVLTKGRTLLILKEAAELGLSANAAAKKHGFKNATVLRKAAQRHKLGELYQVVVSR